MGPSFNEQFDQHGAWRRAFAQQLKRQRVGLDHPTTTVQHHDPTRQDIQQTLQTLGQSLLFCQLFQALGTGLGQLGAVLLWVLIIRGRYLARYPLSLSLRG